MKKIISVLGATGSVGRQALDVARERGFLVDFLCANRDAVALETYAREFRPKAVAMADEKAALDLKDRLSDTSVKVLCGESGIEEGIAAGCGVDAPGSFVAWLSQSTRVYAMEMPGSRYDIGNLES